MTMTKTRRSPKAKIAMGAALALVGTAVVTSATPPAVPVQLGTVQAHDVEQTIDERGSTRIRTKYLISAPVSGHLERISLQPGDGVGQADVVARIAPATPQLLDERTRTSAVARVDIAKANRRRARAAEASARAQLAFARKQLLRGRKLLTSEGVSQQQLEQLELEEAAALEAVEVARVSVDAAVLELTAARAALAPTGQRGSQVAQLEVVAPGPGRILRVFTPSEGVVQAGTALVEVGDPAALEIVVDVLTTDAVEIEPGAVARIDGWGRDASLSARVRRKEPSAYTTRSALGVQEQRVGVVLDLIDAPERLMVLGDGYRVEAHIRVANRDQTLAVPASALFREQAGWAAYVVRDDARAEKVQVALGIRSLDWAEVKDGLGLGDFVVEYPTDRVSDGVRVKRLGKSTR